MVFKTTDLFHVHTFRCGHAENVPDIEYVKKAIDLGATSIWFTDHAPFPGDEIIYRMRCDQLDEYMETISDLKKQFAGTIDIHLALEAEYFPTFDKDGYYKELLSKEPIEFLLLGQHMAESEPYVYSYTWDDERRDKEEYLALGNAEIQGMLSGYFSLVAHPDRIFRRQERWTDEMTTLANRIIDTARKTNIPIEINESSKRVHHLFWDEFWALAKDVQTFRGLDAHHLDELMLLEQ